MIELNRWIGAGMLMFVLLLIVLAIPANNIEHYKTADNFGLKMSFDTNYTYFYKNSNLIAKERWIVEDNNRTELTPIITHIYDSNNLVEKSRHYAHSLILESMHFKNNLTNIEHFPENYTVHFEADNQNNYSLIWELTDLTSNYKDGTYYACNYVLGNVKIDLKDNCKDLNKVEISGDTALIYFQNKRGTQYYDIGFFDPKVQEVKKEAKPIPFISEGWDFEIDSTYISEKLDYSVDVIQRDTFGKPTEVKVNWQWKKGGKAVIMPTSAIESESSVKSRINAKNKDYIVEECTTDEKTMKKTCKNVTKTKYYLGKKFEKEDYNNIIALKQKGMPTNRKIFLDVKKDKGSFTTEIAEGNPVKIGFHTTTITLLYRNNDSYQPNDNVIINMSIQDIDLHDMQFYFKQEENTDNSLVGWWSFDNSTDFTDRSGNGNDGTNMGTTYTEGIHTGARTLANNYVFCGNDSSLRTEGLYTYSFWMNTSYCSPGEAYISNGHEYNHWIGLVIRSWYDNKIIGQISGLSYGILFSTNTYCNGLWHHYAVTYNGTHVLAYFDNALVDIKPASNMSLNNVGFKIGDVDGWYTDHATIDEVKVWNRTLTEEEIEEQYYLERTRFYDDSLVLQMDFNNISAIGENSTYAVDASQYGNNGTIEGGATYADGKYGLGLEFDKGSDCVKTDIFKDYMNMNEITISFWINMNENTTGNVGVVDNMWNDDKKGFQVFISNTNYFNFLTRSSTGQFEDISTANPITVNTWNYLVFTKKYNSDFSIYINGVLDANETSLYQIGNASFDTSIGNNRLCSDAINGTIDAVRIYNRSLSAEEVKQHYQSNLHKYSNDDWEFYTNQTNLTESTYDFYAWVNDTAGTETTSTTYTYTYDAGSPYISFVSPTPANNTYTAKNWTYINVTTTDGHPGTSLVDWNNSLVGWWRFNKGSGTVVEDFSGHGNNGTMINMNAGIDNGSSGWTSGGKYGNGMNFDGSNDYVNCGNDFSLDITDEVTIEAWVKYSSSFSGIRGDIVSKHQTVDHVRKGYGLAKGDDNKIHWWPANGTSWNELVSTITVSPNTWYHIVCTNDANYRKIYINGIKKGSDTGVATITSSALDLFIGKNTEGAFYFNGIIDEVKIYNRALSPEEINASYNAGLYRLYHNFTDLAEGEYTYTAYSQDMAGNVNQTETRTITVDTTNPYVKILYPVNGEIYNEGSHDLNYTSSDTNLDTTWYEYNNTNTTLTANTTFTATEGQSTLTLWANDTAGNTNHTSIIFTVDTTPPYVEILSPSNTTYNTTNITLNYTSTDTNLNATWYEYNNTNTTLTANTTFTATEGQSTLTLWANDTAGNTNSTNITFTTDTISPTLILYSPADMTYTSTTIPLNYTSSDPHLDTTWYEYNCTNTTLTTNTTIYAPNKQDFTLTLWANDTLGNTASLSRNFTVIVRTGGGGGTPPPPMLGTLPSYIIVTPQKNNTPLPMTTYGSTCFNYEVENLAEYPTNVTLKVEGGEIVTFNNKQYNPTDMIEVYPTNIYLKGREKQDIRVCVAYPSFLSNVLSANIIIDDQVIPLTMNPQKERKEEIMDYFNKELFNYKGFSLNLGMAVFILLGVFIILLLKGRPISHVYYDAYDTLGKKKK